MTCFRKRMFNQQEVQILIGGVNSPIDLNDLRQHTNYGGLYDDNHPVIVTFWNVCASICRSSTSTAGLTDDPFKVVNSLDQEQRRALLRFVTSCSRPPLLFVFSLSLSVISRLIMSSCNVGDLKSSYLTFRFGMRAKTSTDCRLRVLVLTSSR